MLPKTDLTIEEANQHLLTSVDEQIRDLQPGLQKQAEIAIISVELKRLETMVASYSDNGLNNDLTDLVGKVTAFQSGIQSGEKTLSDFGEVLAGLYALQQSLEKKLQERLENLLITNADKENVEGILLRIIMRARQLLNNRPDVNAVMDDLTALKNLKGGPADATAFHDFQVLQLAFKSVWMHAFHEDLKTAVEKLYADAVKLYNHDGLNVPDFKAINDINEYHLNK